jgi:flagellar motor protein MotB
MVAAAGVLALAGCGSKLKDENAALADEARMLRAQLADRNEALDAANADRRELELENADLRRQVDESMRTARTPTTTGFEGIPGVDVQFGAGEITVSIASDVLFDSGKATLKSSAKQSLDQVASVLKSQYSGRAVRIAGHTDSDPIKKSGWKSNYHLGAERAFTVMDFLKSKGVEEGRMYIASFGPNRPAGSKAQSRRVEIAVVTTD